jgi:hypothetical protein
VAEGASGSALTARGVTWVSGVCAAASATLDFFAPNKLNSIAVAYLSFGREL